jgi:drug/metabolite transporter (DMT)-like permease
LIAMRSKQLLVGIFCMLCAALSSSLGQLIWKIMQGKESYIIWYCMGLALYGIGAVLMIIAFRFGDLSILHPMISLGFIFAFFWSVFILKEKFTPTRLIGVTCIILGCVSLSLGERKPTTPNE